jgi:NtrC-family two-component system sensor histidine kinase KinB
VEVEGELRLLTYSLTPVSHTQGHILGAVMVLHDVTEQRAFERVRSEFVLRASHELRTPVTGMHMAFGLFRERAKFPADSREADLLDTVNEEMQRLMQLINDLLNFSRYQNGLQKLTLGPCDVIDLLEHARARFRASQHATYRVAGRSPIRPAAALCRSAATGTGTRQPAGQRPAPHRRRRADSPAGASPW